MFSVRDLTRVSWECLHFVSEEELSAVRQELLRVHDVAIAEMNVWAVETDADLFRVLSSAMRFPDYFGHNWDAVDECLGDLSWLPAHGYVLIADRSDMLWRNTQGAAGKLAESWLFCAEEWGRKGVPFHLVFVL